MKGVNKMEKEFSNICLKNFGILKDANIDIAPLTVFTGANSSGKSFVAKLIHSFSSSNIDDFHRDIDLSFSNTSKYFDEEHQKLFTQLSQEISQFFKNNFNKTTESFKIPMELFDDLLNDGIFKYFSINFEERINEEFEENLDNLININHNFFEISINNYEFLKEKGKSLDFNPALIELVNTVYTTLDNETIAIELESDEEFIYLKVKSTYNFKDFDSIFPIVYASFAHSILDNVLLEKSYYIPAERLEIIIDRKMLSRRVKNESDMSKTQSDVLYNIINIDCDKKGYFYDLGCEFDKEFSGISIDVEQKDFINNIIYSDLDSGNSISSKILSTSIHEMTLFSLYLKYVLKKGDLLIIEEPEAHLHPKNQLLLLKYIVRAVNNGLKIMLTTHSEYISDQLNNFVRLNNISYEKCLELNYSEENILNAHDLHIYNFKEFSKNQYVTEKLEIDETGFFEENFTKVMDELYNETLNITNSSIR